MMQQLGFGDTFYVNMFLIVKQHGAVMIVCAKFVEGLVRKPVTFWDIYWRRPYWNPKKSDINLEQIIKVFRNIIVNRKVWS